MTYVTAVESRLKALKMDDSESYSNEFTIRFMDGQFP